MLIDDDLDELLNDKEAAPAPSAGSHKRKSLGRGLGALLGDDSISISDAPAEVSDKHDALMVDIKDIKPSKYQPRTEFDKEALQSLAESIREKGVLQPLLVRKQGGQYELIAGERRWRASKIAGLNQVPVIIKDFEDKEVLEVALVENLLRENLSAIEEAEGFQRLIDEFSHTQEALSQIVGKSRSHIANTLRLLNLPASVQELVKENKLSAGHARALVGLENAEALAKQIVSKDLSVRQVEELVAKQKEPRQPKAKKTKNEDLEQIEQELIKNLGLRLKITPNKQGGGKVVLQYASVAELDMIIETLEQKRRNDVQPAANAVFKAEQPASPSEKFSIKIVD